MPGIMEIFEKGGATMPVILLASIIGVACIVYCMMILRRQVLLPADLVKLAESTSTPLSVESIKSACEKEGGPFAEILMTVIATRESTREEAEGLVEAAGRRAVHDLSRGPLALEVVAAVSPLLGLLGTVLGMYKAFDKLSLAGAKDIGNLSLGIKEALITTICGLVVAIPAFVAYTWFSQKVDSLVLQMERCAMELMSRVRAENK
ncbi:MAG: MotA/TolQ/ExbB proton channel family protein [Planctomycetes bacterium]|nr:MotA/TolQ/ExbB proton channel family protein [Planctomycetota bacterium]